MFSSMSRRSILSRSFTTSLRSSTTGCTVCLRLKISSCRVKPAARSAAGRIVSRLLLSDIVRAESLHHQIAVTHDDGQDVVEVMGHAAGELADHFHFLRFDELRLQPSGVRPVPRLPAWHAAPPGTSRARRFLEDIIRRAALERINGPFLAQRPGNENERYGRPFGMRRFSTQTTRQSGAASNQKGSSQCRRVRAPPQNHPGFAPG